MENASLAIKLRPVLNHKIEIYVVYLLIEIIIIHCCRLFISISVRLTTLMCMANRFIGWLFCCRCCLELAMVLKSFIYAHSSFLNKNSWYKSVTVVSIFKSSNYQTHYSWIILSNSSPKRCYFNSIHFLNNPI